MKSPKIQITIIYAVLSVIWITFSDQLLLLLLDENTPQYSSLQTLKGLFFVITVAILLYVLLNRYEKLVNTKTEALSRSETDFRHLFRDNPLALGILERQTARFLEVNDELLLQYGYSRSEILQMTIFDMARETKAPEQWQAVLAILDATNRYFLPKLVLYSKPGQPIETEIVGHPFSFQGQPAILVVIHDITERNRALKALQDRDVQMTHLFNNLDDMVWIMDLKSGMAYQSPNVARLMGFETTYFTDLPPRWWMHVHPDDLDAVFGELHQWVKTGKREITYRVVAKQGEIRWIHDRAWTIYDDEGNRIRFEGVYTDVTEHYTTTEQRRENQKLQFALTQELKMREWRNRFISMISHETRNPLGVITMSLSMLETYYDRLTPERRKDQYSKIHRQLQRLVQLADDVSAVIRSDSKTPYFHEEDVDVAEVCLQIAEQACDFIQENQSLEQEFMVAHAVVRGDRKLIHHAINNLVKNAVKYTPNGGKITFGLNVQDNEVSVWVYDSGIGIPEHELEHIFDEFYRASNVGTLQGSGLGLAITKQAVEFHRGRIEVTSQVQKGTQFRIFLPLQTPDSTTA